MPPVDEQDPDQEDTPAVVAARSLGLTFTVTRHGRVSSLEEAAAARGVRPADIVKSLVVRLGEGDFLFVLVPGDRQFSWKKLRALLGANRVSMPDAEVAREVTGYERGTITPFGSAHAWPVVADADIAGRTVSLGGGAHGVAMTAQADDFVRVLDARLADISD
ncbi:MAG: YbaK/EbsC family protein [Actinomycetota bacterium]|nr:YbaK/EbsC family protein [Actinomycetota bacterium]